MTHSYVSSATIEFFGLNQIYFKKFSKNFYFNGISVCDTLHNHFDYRKFFLKLQYGNNSYRQSSPLTPQDWAGRTDKRCICPQA